MVKGKTADKPIYKQWWFWVAIVVVLGIIGFATQGANNTNTSNNSDNNSSQTGTLPTLNKDDYMGKEGLVVFKELKDKGYSVTAKYENPAVPATNQELTDQFASANITSCSDRLGWDAYVISNLTQTGDTVALITTIKANDNQECPAGTTNDL
jgi:hypothetical protein